mmetsp:Transcript_90580/g.157201  ORF Transcript_90580/g.157201 Transcript_90580/m.157201 type:complete len:176 (-) Transcript_90580:110-637(-)
MEVAGAKICAVPNCHTEDFLPFQCDCCKQFYCVAHWTYEAHSCPKATGRDCRVIICPLCKNSVRLVAGEEVSVTFARHRDSKDCSKKVKKKCPAPGCKETLGIANTFHCPRCDQDVCLRHRFEDDHPCKKVQPSGGKPVPTGAWEGPAKTTVQLAAKPKKGFFCCLCGGKPKVRE